MSGKRQELTPARRPVSTRLSDEHIRKMERLSLYLSEKEARRVSFMEILERGIDSLLAEAAPHLANSSKRTRNTA